MEDKEKKSKIIPFQIKPVDDIDGEALEASLRSRGFIVVSRTDVVLDTVATSLMGDFPEVRTIPVLVIKEEALSLDEAIKRQMIKLSSLPPVVHSWKNNRQKFGRKRK